MKSKLLLADNNKLVIGDIINYKGKKHIIEGIRRCGQQTIRSITTNSHHLSAICNIYTLDASRV